MIIMCKKSERLYETNYQDGEVIKIIAYRNCNDIDVMFEDEYSTVAYNQTYSNFKN
jgi:hypothetical protein